MKFDSAHALELPGPEAPASDWLGARLGERTVSWTDRDPILFALAIGIPADRLDLVFENQLRVLPPFALTLAQWAPDVLGGAGAFHVGTALHGAQKLESLAPLPASGQLTMTATVGAVWDKGSAAVYDVVVESDYFVATWSLFAPGRGGFGGERGPGRPPAPEGQPQWESELPIPANAAALYRLLGDRHHIHIDPVAAAGIDQPRPILHGLATLSAAAVAAADAAGSHPADITHLEGRFAAPVLPGQTLTVRGWSEGRFEVSSANGKVISAAGAEFGSRR